MNTGLKAVSSGRVFSQAALRERQDARPLCFRRLAGFVTRWGLTFLALLCWTAWANASPAPGSAEWERELNTIDALVENDGPAAESRIVDLQRAYPADGGLRTKLRLLTVASKVFTLNSRTEEALASAEQACAIAAQFDQVAIGEANLRLAGALDLLGRSDEALAAAERSVNHLEHAGSPVLLSEALSRLNLIFIRRGETDKAAACATRSLEIAESVHDPLTSARAHGAMGHALYQSDLFAEARKHYEEMLSFARKGPSKRILADALGRLAVTSGARGNLSAEESLHREALVLWRQTRHHPNLPLSLANLAFSLHQGGRDADALPLLDEAIKIYEVRPYQTGLLYALDNRSESRLTLGDVAGALADAEAAHAIALKVGSGPMQIDTARHAAAAAAALGDYRRAYDWSTKLDTLSVAASRDSINRQVAELEARYAAERKQREIAELAQLNARQAAELEHRRLRQYLLASLLGGSLATMAIVGGLLFRLRRGHRDLRQTHAQLTEAHAELRAKTAFQESQLQSTLDGILVVDPAGKKLFQNQRLNEILGITSEIARSEHEGAQLEYVMTRVKEPLQFRKRIEAIYAHARETSHDEIEMTNGSVLDRYSAPVVAGDGSHYGRIWVFRDVTDQKRAERDRLVFGKLESTGILAGGIAHDYNNLLTVILLNLEMAASAAPGAPKDDYLQAAREATDAARGLTHQLITFAQGGAPVRQPTALGPLLREATASALNGSNLRSDFVLPPDLRPVEIDPGQISQVVRNMILNAREAQPDGGRVTVAAAQVALVEGELPSVPPGDYVRISIIDRGVGIPPDILPKIFDPYFSTKERGTQKGMGLGLTVCHSVVQKHGGAITVESSGGLGTTFHVYLPAHSPALRPVPEDQRSSPAPHTTRVGHILVMDDETSMRETLATALRRFGHTVQLVAEGEAAIETYREANRSSQPFDAVLLDLTVRGGMGGKEALRRLLALDPTIKAVVMSGYADDEVMRAPEAVGFRAALSKPFTLQMLLDVLSQVL